MYHSGKADDTLKRGNVTQSFYFYQVTTVALSVLQNRGYDVYVGKQKDASNDILRKEQLLKDMSQHQPQFHYWNETMHFY